MTDLEYRTVTELQAARAALEASLVGYRYPAAYGLGVVTDAGTEFPAANVGSAHLFPAAVLAAVTGHRDGTTTYRLTRARFGEAIAMLAPAGACSAYDHPNLCAWQGVAERLRTGALPAATQLVAVFIADLGAPANDVHQEALLRAVGSAPS